MRELLKEQVLVLDANHWRFTQDYKFNSPSTAGAIAAGRSVNGRYDWRDERGRSLAQIEEEESEQS